MRFFGQHQKNKSNKYLDVVHVFSEDYDLDIQKKLKEELFAYNKDQEVFHW